MCLLHDVHFRISCALHDVYFGITCALPDIYFWIFFSQREAFVSCFTSLCVLLLVSCCAASYLLLLLYICGMLCGTWYQCVGWSVPCDDHCLAFTGIYSYGQPTDRANWLQNLFVSAIHYWVLSLTADTIPVCIVLKGS